MLDGKHVDLKESIANYFRAVALNYVDDALDLLPFPIRLSSSQKQCASKVLFNHIYDNTESAAKLIDLIQNISVAVSIIKQVDNSDPYVYVYNICKYIYIYICIHRIYLNRSLGVYFLLMIFNTAFKLAWRLFKP